MKRLLLSLIGVSLLSVLPHAHAESLYESVRKGMEKELQSKDVDEDVAKFIAALAKENEWGITQDEVKDIVEGSTGVCSKHETLNGLGCLPILDRIKEIVSFENAVRVAGRRLQSIATGYELPVSELPGRSSTVLGDLSGVVNIWKAGTGSLTSSGTGNTIPSIAVEEEEEKELQPLFDNLGSALGGLSDEERIAAVWKYQYGERLIRNERKPDFPAPVVNADDCDTSERRFLCKRWPDVESALDALWTKLRELYGTDPEQPVFYVTMPKGFSLPDDIILWARMDKDPEHPRGDVGLQFKYPLKPVLPSLTDDEGFAILGGNYPPEPAKEEEENTGTATKAKNEKKETGSGLCSMTFAARGYLCHPVVQTSAAGCPKPEEGDANSIVLVGCTFDAKEKTTEAGPDVCEDITWQSPDKAKGGKIEETVCTPETLTQYKNTIGNNLCFIGQCVEQSLELHRVVAGRTPAVTEGSAYPYDDLKTGSPLGNFLASPTSGNPILPPYKPLEPVREFEAALCALVGLPAGSPSALCTIAADRRMGSPLEDGFATLLSAVQIRTQQNLSREETLMLAESMGTRMGTDLYARNLRVMSKTLSEVLGIASKLLNEVKSIDFPTEMCPLGTPPPDDAPVTP